MGIIKNLSIILLTISSLNLSSCMAIQSPQQQLSGWNGKNTQALFTTFGQADATYQTAEGNTVYVYISQEIHSTPSYPAPARTIVTFSNNKPIAKTYTGTTGGELELLYCRRSFEVNRNGVVVNAYSQGNHCD